MVLLKDMHVFARGPQSSLEDDQIAAIRVRWEREKRKLRAEEPAKPKRRTTKKAAAVAEPEPPVKETGKPSKRRRTAAEVAETEAQHEAERQAEAAAAAAAFDLERPTFEKPELPEITGQPMPTIEERARALFKDLPPLPVEAEAEPVEAPPPPAGPERPTPPPAPAPSVPPVVH